MPILIDGYNLLNVTGIVGTGTGRGSLQRSRLAMLNFLAASIDPAEVSHTTVVFDAHDPPPGLPRVVNHGGITVCFAARDETADERIAALIREHSAPRRLIVVSSDHQVQRAARRRRAKAVDSDVWYAGLIHARHERERAAAEPTLPSVPLLQEDVEYWLREFGGESELVALWSNTPKSNQGASEKPNPEHEQHTIKNPFPPGYADDLIRDL